MKNIKSNLLKQLGCVFIISTLVSCGPSANEIGTTEAVLADSISKQFQKTKTTLKTFKHDSDRVFVRNADMKFKVNDVNEATIQIEKIVNENNGYVIKSFLESEINNKTAIRTEKDSIKDIITYTVKSDITVKIPNSKLDNALAEISNLIEQIEYRKIQAEDVTAQLSSFQFSENRFLKHKKRLESTISKTGGKLNDVLAAETSMVLKQELADESRIGASEILHDVEFSTVVINIYQREKTKTETHPYIGPLDPYTPTYVEKVSDAFISGTAFFGNIFLFLITILPATVCIIALVFLARFLIRKTKMFI